MRKMISDPPSPKFRLLYYCLHSSFCCGRAPLLFAKETKQTRISSCGKIYQQQISVMDVPSHEVCHLSHGHFTSRFPQRWIKLNSKERSVVENYFGCLVSACISQHRLFQWNGEQWKHPFHNSPHIMSSSSSPVWSLLSSSLLCPSIFSSFLSTI